MDDYAREMMELKTLVTRTLEKKGVLAKIRVRSCFPISPSPFLHTLPPPSRAHGSRLLSPPLWGSTLPRFRFQNPHVGFFFANFSLHILECPHIVEKKFISYDSVGLVGKPRAGWGQIKNFQEMC
jgi:hypothetical protein